MGRDKKPPKKCSHPKNEKRTTKKKTNRLDNKNALFFGNGWADVNIQNISKIKLEFLCEAIQATESKYNTFRLERKRQRGKRQCK